MIKRLHNNTLLPLLLLTSLLTACGFQLRGKTDIASDLAQLSVTGSDLSFVRDLRRALSNTGIEVRDNTPYRVRLVSLDQNTGQQSRASAGNYERLLTLTAVFQLETADGLQLYNPLVLSNERYVTQDQNLTNAAQNEQRIIFQELRQDLIMSSVRRIAAISEESLQQEADRARKVRQMEIEALEARE